MAYWIQWILGISFFSYLVFLCHKKGKIALRDALIYIYIYGCVAHADNPPFSISDDMSYTLLIAVTFSIIFVNCILDRMNKGMLVVCFLLIAIMAKTYLVFSLH
ncbi:MAG: hypothetical protein JSR93_09545 [Verrucomicrobia bacterium]|nr:hypothetical protein [Verrucomicrobiota bacterium]